MGNSRNKGIEGLVEAHLGVIRPIALSLKRGLPASIQLTDLESAGRAALVEAVRQHVPASGIPLAARVRVKVRGAMLDSIKGAAYREACHGELPAVVPDQGRSPEQEAIDQDGACRAAAAIASLTAKQRLVLQLRYFENLSERETARRARISVEAVKRRRSRAVAELRQLLGQERLSVRAIAIALSAWETPGDP